jgi:hypothetical protein
MPLYKWIWILLTIGLAIPLLFPLGIGVTIDESTVDFFDILDQAPERSLILYKMDPSPGFWEENRPWQLAVMYHCAINNLRLVIYTSNDYSVGYDEIGIAELKPELDALGYTYGEDYINLGYIPGIITSTVILSERPQESTTNDARGNPIMSLPIMQDFDSGDDVYAIGLAGLDNLSAGVTYFRERYGTYVINACAAAALSESLAFYQTGQIQGMLKALHGYAEYEQMIGRPGPASAQLDAQSIGHLIILLGLIAGNIVFFMRRARGEEDVRIGWSREV